MLLENELQLSMIKQLKPFVCTPDFLVVHSPTTYTVIDFHQLATEM